MPRLGMLGYATRGVDAALGLLAAQVLLILLTGGYTFTGLGVTLKARGLDLPLVVLLLLVILRRVLAAAAASSRGRLASDTWLLFAALLVIYLANGRTLWSADTIPARYLPLSIVREGDFDLDEFPFLYAEGDPYFLRLRKGHRVSDYPVGAALLALPLYLPSALGRVSPASPFLVELEKVAAATMVALSGVVLYLALRRLTSRVMALLITLVYALGTSSLSVSSQALWQHGPSQLAITVALYCLVRGRRQPRWVALAGFPLAFAVITRPSDLLLALPLAAYVVLHHRSQVWGFLATGFPPGLFQLWYNARYFGDPFRTQWPLVDGIHWRTPFWDGLLGLLLSPARGLFVYSPIFLFSVLGIGLSWRRGGDTLLRWSSLGALLVILPYTKWMNWWGGWTYGPRLLADLTPVLALSLYPLEGLVVRSRAARAVFVAAVAWSVMAHSIGAFWDDRYWNEARDVDRAPEHLWSWTDNQLVNPVKELSARAAVIAGGQPTSRSAPALLAASYHADAPPVVTTRTARRIEIRLQATNVGTATWLAWPRRAKGVVTLGWQWRRDGSEMASVPRGAPLHADVFPQQSHPFHLSIDPPDQPGTYLLEVGLVAEKVARFSDLGVPPVRLTVTVTDGGHPGE